MSVAVRGVDAEDEGVYTAYVAGSWTTRPTVTTDEGRDLRKEWQRVWCEG